jgi:hypothetical protein
MSKRVEDMDEPEIESLLNGVGGILKRMLPGQLWCLVVFGDDGIGQYVSNAQRAGVISNLRDFADALESREDVPR